MKIAITLEFSDEDRQALAWKWGQLGKADRKTIEKFVKAAIDGNLVDYKSQRDADDPGWR